MIATQATQDVNLEWLDRFASEVLAATRANTVVDNACIFGTRLAGLALQRLGLDVRLQPVWLTLFNAEARALADRATPIADWPDTAWSAGINEHDPPIAGGWNGHLVAILRRPGHPRVLIDVTADQFDKPEHGIVLGGPVVAAIPADTPWTPMDPLWLRMVDTQTSLAIRPMSAGVPAASVWRETHDGQVPDERFDVLVSEILRRTE